MANSMIRSVEQVALQAVLSFGVFSEKSMSLYGNSRFPRQTSRLFQVLFDPVLAVFGAIMILRHRVEGSASAAGDAVAAKEWSRCRLRRGRVDHLHA
jgi:hypothetical protein